MIALWQAVFLGIVQGLTEFLPISSSAHLALAPWLLGFEAGFLHTLTFDVALHMGTLAAVLLYFWRDWLAMAAVGVGILARRPTRREQEARLLAFLIIGSLPAALAGLLLERQADEAFRDPLLMAGTLAGFGVLLGLADHWRRGVRTLGAVSWRDAVLIGAAQAVALVPGVSRSGVTITAGLGLGLTRDSAARFSFLLMAPVVAGAGLLKGVKLLGHGLPPDQLFALTSGTVAAAVAGVAAISLLLRYLRKGSIWPFVAYRLALAALVAGVALSRPS